CVPRRRRPTRSTLSPYATPFRPALPGIDPARVAVHGVSQGGGIAIAVAALADGLVGAMPDVPFLCHYRRAVEITDRDPYRELTRDRKSTRLNSSHVKISYAVFCL